MTQIEITQEFLIPVGGVIERYLVASILLSCCWWYFLASWTGNLMEHRSGVSRDLRG